jgi:fibronectin-binding autotransporter adhesin
MKRLLCYMLSASYLAAAPIRFDPPVNMAADTDALTSGTFIYGYTWSNTNRVVNGVTFTSSNVSNGNLGTNLTLANFASISQTAFTSTANPFNALSAAYKGLVTGAFYNAAVTGLTGTVTLNGLTIGQSYKVQVWVSDARSGTTTTRTQSITGPAGSNTQPMDFNVGNVGGGVGQYVIGTFTADASTQQFSIVATSGSPPQVNALQLRTANQAPSWSGQVSSVWDESTLNFSGSSFAQVKSSGGPATFGDTTATGTTPTRTLVEPVAAGVTGTNVVFSNAAQSYTLSNLHTLGFYGNHTLSKINTGTVLLNGPNTFTGDTKLAGGIVQVRGELALQNSTVSGEGGNLEFRSLSSAAFGGLKGSVALLLEASSVPVQLRVGSNNQNTTFAGNLSGTGKLTKEGTGTLTLSGTNTHAESVANAGTLIINGSHSGKLTASGGSISLVNNAIATTTVSGLTMTSGAVAIELGAAGTDTLQVNGDVALSGGSMQLNFLSVPPVGIPLPLVNYTGTLTGSPTITHNTRLSYTLDPGTGANSAITITFGPPLELRWLGNVSTQWADDPTLNFLNPNNTADRFYQLDSVLFDDSGTKTVAMAVAVTPHIATIRNAAGVANNYTFTGSFAGGSVVKEGSGTAIFTANTNAPRTVTVQEGTLQIGNNTTAGIFTIGVPIQVNSAGTLRYVHTSSPYNIQQPLAGSGTLVCQGPNVSAQGGYVAAADNSAFSGTMIMEKSRLQIDAAADLGSAKLRTGDGGQFYFTQVAAVTLTNSLEIVGNGWVESVGALGAIRLQGNSYAGPISLLGPARIGVYGTSGQITGQTAEVGGAHALEFRNGHPSTNGSFTVAGPSSRTGPTNIAGAALTLQNSTGLGSGSISLLSNGTAARTTSLILQNVRITNNVLLNSEAATAGISLLQATGGEATVSGSVTLNIAPQSGSVLGSDDSSSLNLLGALNAATGLNLTIGAAANPNTTVGLGGGGNYTALTLLGGTLRVLATQGIALNATLNVATTSAARLDLNGQTQHLTTISNANANFSVINTAAVPSTLRLAPTAPTTAAYTLQGALNFEKAGTGDLTLSNAAYVGDTTVQQGKLSLTTAFLSNTHVVELNAGATLGLNHTATDAVRELRILGIPQAAGLWGAVGSGTEHESAHLTGTGLLLVIDGPVPSPYQMWMDNFLSLTPATKTPTADPDGDGLSNLAEFAFGSNPSDAQQQVSLTASYTAGTGYSYRIALREGATVAGNTATVDGIQCRIEASTDLVAFTTPVVYLGESPAPGAPAGCEWHVFRLADGQRGFLRAVVAE